MIIGDTVAHFQIEKSGQGRTVKSNSRGHAHRSLLSYQRDTFFVGQNNLEIVDVDTYSSIDSASTSYGKATYRGYNFACE